MQRRDLLAASAGLMLAAPALGQGAWPARTIRIIVPFTPGGATDGMARITAAKLTEKLGQTVVVENRAGANGAVGGIAASQAAPDGHTLLFSASIQVMARFVMRSPGYDPVTDLLPVARVGRGALLFVMNNDRPQTTITEVVAAARANPNQWAFAASSLGAAGHLATIEFNRLAGLDLTIASYRGTAPALADVIAGNVQLMFDPLLATLPQVRGGRVKALAITTPERSPIAPDIPSAPESGMPGLDFASWYGIWAPPRTPAEIVNRINEVLRVAMLEPDVTERLNATGFEAVAETPAQFAAFIARDVERNAELLRIAKFEPQ